MKRADHADLKTGYYYSRWRPGVAVSEPLAVHTKCRSENGMQTVLTFLVLLSVGLQYIVHQMNYKRDLERVERFIAAARRAAWGPKLNRTEIARNVSAEQISACEITRLCDRLGGPIRSIRFSFILAGSSQFAWQRRSCQ